MKKPQPPRRSGSRTLTGILALVFTLAGSSLASLSGQTASSLTVSGITWQFDKAYQYGQFVNGDFWVVVDPSTRAVRITRITPDAAGGRNGWEVNPVGPSRQPYDSRVNEGQITYDGSLQPALPYNAQANQSIVKTVSVTGGDSCLPCLSFSAVLTVLSTPPASDAFRPPYVGTSKPMYFEDALDLSVLPALNGGCCPSAPSLARVEARFRHLVLDHFNSWRGRFIHPSQSCDDGEEGVTNCEYGSQISVDYTWGALRLMLDDPQENKRQALINYVQHGIDLYHIARLTGGWPNRNGGGGHMIGRRIPVLIAGMLLQDEDIMDFIGNHQGTIFGEDDYIYYSARTGLPRWGYLCDPADFEYWQGLANAGNQRVEACRDPYGYIDGSIDPGANGYLHCCTAMPFKYQALTVRLLQARPVWNHDAFLEWVDRWVAEGVVTQPDPCAPLASWPAGHGTQYGPDGNGDCIRDQDSSNGIGRFPSNHGRDVDGGFYDDAFGNQMWRAYRDLFQDSSPPTAPTNLRTTAIGSSRVDLSWNASTDDVRVAGYRIYRNGSQVKTATGTTGFDSGLTPETSYNYTVRAYDAAGNESASSNQVSARTIADVVPPAAPSGLRRK